jgi:hypothetical protein
MPTMQSDSSRWSRLLHQLSRHREAIAFWSVAILYVAPVWIFPYFPTLAALPAGCVAMGYFEQFPPLLWVAGVDRGRGGWIGCSSQDAVDVILCWQPGPPGAGWRGPAGWDEIFRQGALQIYRRPLKR